MKRRTIIAVLLAIVLLLIPSTALAGDPSGTEVNIGVNAGGDLEVNFEGQADGNAEYNLYGSGVWNVNDDGLATMDAVLAMRGDGDEWTYQQVRINKGDIATLKENQAIIWKKIGNDMTHDIWALVDATAMNWRTNNWQGIDIASNFRASERNTSQIEILGNKDKGLEDYDTVLAREIDVAKVKIAQLEAKVAQNEARANLRLFLVIGVALAIVISLGIKQGRLRRKIRQSK